MGRVKKIINGTMARISQKTIDASTLYNFTDRKHGTFTGTEMTALLTHEYEGFVKRGEVYYCSESGGTYTQGHFYKFTITGTSPVDNVASWTDLGALGGGSQKYTHTIVVDNTTAVGTYHYQFSFTNDVSTAYTQLGQIGHYLFSNNKTGIRIPATGLYTASTDKYLVTAIKSEIDNMVSVEMYKVTDGTFNSISTGVIDVTDYVE